MFLLHIEPEVTTLLTRNDETKSISGSCTTLMLNYRDPDGKIRVIKVYELTNPAKKETPHSFKGQQLENKSLYRFVIYMVFLEKYLSYNLTLSL